MEKKAILIVDDEKNIRMTVSQALESLDAPIETAVNGEDALEKLSKNNFSVVILDLKMAGMDGMEVLRLIRSKSPDIAIIIITAYGSIETAVEAMKLRALDFIQKPFTPDKIREIVKHALDQKESQNMVGQEKRETYEN